MELPNRLVLITSTTASSSASISFTTGISSNFSTYMAKIRNFTPATNASTLRLTFSTDGGGSYLNTNYKRCDNYCTSGAASAAEGSDSDSSLTLVGNLSNTKVMNMDLILYNLNSNTFSPLCMDILFSISGTGESVLQWGGGLNTTTTAINAIKFAMSAGNITSGTISLYGVQDGGFLY